MNRVLAILVCLSLCGCGSYRLGTTLPPGLRSIHVPTVANATTEPGVEASVTAALSEEFQRDGTLRVATAETADMTMEVTVTRFRLVPLRYNRDRTTTAEEFRLILTARVRVVRTEDGGVMIDRPGYEGETEFELNGDLRSAKRNALPDAARDLAHDIVESIVEYW